MGIPAIVKKTIDGTSYDLAIRTNANNVIMDDQVTPINIYLSETFSKYATAEEMKQAIQEAIDAVIDGAPEAMDTLREIADWVESHEELYDGLVASLANKVEKIEGKGLSQKDFTEELKTKLENIEARAQVNTVTSVAGKTGSVVLNKSDVGLDRVNNTNDLEKPISNAVSNALEELKNSLDHLNTEDIVSMKQKIQDIIDILNNNNVEELAETLDGLSEGVKASDQHIGNNSLHITSEERKIWNSKVDSVAGKVLSDNNYSSDEKIKLSGIEAGATKTVIANDLETASAGKALDAAQGRLLNEKLNSIAEKQKSAVSVAIPEQILDLEEGVAAPLELYTNVGKAFTVNPNNISFTGIKYLEVSGQILLKDIDPEAEKQVKILILNGEEIIHTINLSIQSILTPLLVDVSNANRIKITKSGNWSQVTMKEKGLLTVKEV